MPNATLRSNLSVTGGNVKASVTGMNALDSTVEVAAAAAAGTEYVMFTLPSRARIHGTSLAFWDDLASSGSPTLDIGVKPVRDNIDADDDALNDGLALSSASTGTRFIKDMANYGKTLWELAGESSDPGGDIQITFTTKDAACNTGGTITATVHYSVD